MSAWEEIDHRTSRLQVPGGWIYCHTFAPSKIDPHLGLVFVPVADPVRDDLLAAVRRLHAAAEGEEGFPIPCAQGRSCPTCALIAKAESRS